MGRGVVDPFADAWGPELGYAFHPAMWGRGLATELATATVTHADGVLGLAVVSAFVHSENLASRRVLEKAGFGLVRAVPEMRRLLFRRVAPG